MQTVSYDRYGLMSNPFRNLSSETIDNVDIFHVNQSIDNEMKVIKDEVFNKENKAVVVILGGQGVGKTERLMLAANEYKKNNCFFVLRDVESKAKWVINGIIDSMLQNVKKKAFGAPEWYKNLNKIKKNLNSYSFEAISKAIAQVLNENVPSCLLLNDLHNMPMSKSLDLFLRVFHSIIDNLDPGVLVMISCETDYFKGLIKSYPSVDQHINRKFLVQPLNNNEAGLMIAKRMLDKRLVDNIESLYPFTQDSVAILNQEAEGNPRNLLKTISFVIDNAAQRKVMTVEEDLTRELLQIRMNKRLDVKVEKSKPMVEPVSAQPEIGEKIVKPVTLHEIRENPVSMNPNNPSLDVSSEVDIGGIDFETHVVDSSISSPVVNPDYASRDLVPDVPVKTVKKSNGNVVSKKKKGEPHSIRVKCPKCSKIFSFEVDDDTEELRCPNPKCDFIGKINLKK